MTKRTQLLALVAGQVLLIGLYMVFDTDLLFYVNLAWILVLVLDAWNIRCPQCGKGQVFRGWSITDLRLPSEKCFYCGASIESHQRRAER
jgi:hypothetical protein